MADANTQKAQITATAQTAFGQRLLSTLSQQDPQRNVFISPTSVFLALGMLESGAAGATRAALRKTLAIPQDVNEPALLGSAQALSKMLQHRNGAEISIANALWSDRSMKLGPEFVARALEFYDANAQTLDFHSPDAARAINDWVKQQTKGKIAEIVSERAVASANAILTNAVYFKGDWRYPFGKDLTANAPFHLVGATTVEKPFMRRDRLRNVYRSGDSYEAAVLPYGQLGRDASAGGDLVLCVILPAQGKDAAEVTAEIDVKKLLDAANSAELDLRLPKFTLDYGSSLKTVLEKMGMAIAFQSGKADFAPLGSREFFVSDVLHKTRLEVDETGTTAAAATAVIGALAMARPPERKVMIVDRPFGLLLCDRQSAAVLFAGAIYAP